MGICCFLNNATVAAQTPQKGGTTRVAVLDMDSHHGNGTQSIFYDRTDMLFVSLHGHPLTEFLSYPGHMDKTSCSAGQGYNLNLSLTAGCSGVQWFEALETGCARIVRYGAQTPVVSLGLDRFANDPISKFTLLAGDCSRLNRCPASVGLPTVFVLKDGCAAAELGTQTVDVLEGFDND